MKKIVEIAILFFICFLVFAFIFPKADNSHIESKQDCTFLTAKKQFPIPFIPFSKGTEQKKQEENQESDNETEKETTQKVNYQDYFAFSSYIFKTRLLYTSGYIFSIFYLHCPIYLFDCTLRL